ncbi:DNA-binding MarR family transcriptional regulator [Brevirhabdus pacifica]|nr:DNA-binding MarR family transcriptional regulator [Brevirhabdus pacifica]
MSAGVSAAKQSLDSFQEAELNRFITFRIARLHAKLNIQAAKLLAETAGLSLTQWRIIALLGNMGQCNSSDLVRVSAMDKGLLSRRLKSLVQEGLVVSMVDRSDSRVHPLRLSAKGRRLFEETLPHTRRRQAAIRASLTDEELETLFTIFEKLDRAAELTEFD